MSRRGSRLPPIEDRSVYLGVEEGSRWANNRTGEVVTVRLSRYREPHYTGELWPKVLWNGASPGAHPGWFIEHFTPAPDA